MTRPGLALAILLLPAAAAAQPLVTCERTEAVTRPGMIDSREHAVGIEDGAVRRIVLVLVNGQSTTTDLTPMRDGVSVRLTTFTDPRDASRVTAIFNRAVLGADGGVLVETWVRPPGSDQPTYNSYRLRCPVAGGPRK